MTKLNKTIQPFLYTVSVNVSKQEQESLRGYTWWKLLLLF